MVTHDPRYSAYADRTVHLFDGRIVDESVEQNKEKFEAWATGVDAVVAMVAD